MSVSPITIDTAMGRDGWHSVIGLKGTGKATEVAAAKRSAASQASRRLMPPPLERPVA